MSGRRLDAVTLLFEATQRGRDLVDRSRSPSVPVNEGTRISEPSSDITQRFLRRATTARAGQRAVQTQVRLEYRTVGRSPAARELAPSPSQQLATETSEQHAQNGERANRFEPDRAPAGNGCLRRLGHCA